MSMMECRRCGCPEICDCFCHQVPKHSFQALATDALSTARDQVVKAAQVYVAEWKRGGPTSFAGPHGILCKAVEDFNTLAAPAKEPRE